MAAPESPIPIYCPSVCSFGFVGQILLCVYSFFKLLIPYIGSLDKYHTRAFSALILTRPFSKRQNLDSSKLKEFADDNFGFDENGRKFSKTVENTVGKGEIARDEQFLLFPQSFQKICTADA